MRLYGDDIPSVVWQCLPKRAEFVGSDRHLIWIGENSIERPGEANMIANFVLDATAG